MSILKELGAPIFYAEGKGAPAVESYSLRVEGLVREKRVFTFAELKALPNSTVDARLTSVSGWSVRAAWEGVLFGDFLKELELLPRATHASFSSFGGYSTAISLKDLESPRVLLCWGVGGEPLEPEYGGPLRLIVPHLWGYKSVKGLAKVNFTHRMEGGFWEDRGYSREAVIEPGYTLDINTRERRRIAGGEVTEF